MKKYIDESNSKISSNDPKKKKTKTPKNKKNSATTFNLQINDKQKPGPSKQNIELSEKSDLSDSENESEIPDEDKCCQCHQYYVDKHSHGAIEFTHWAQCDKLLVPIGFTLNTALQSVFDIDSNGSADSGIEECAMEVSISEPTTTETFDGSSDIDDILLKSEMLLRSLRGELFSTDSAADDSLQADKTTTNEVSDKPNEAGVSNEKQTKDDTVKEDSGTGSEASHGKKATDDSDVVSQRNLADSNEKKVVDKMK
ncbi:uncharacterized protein LOC132721803 [Ruditapes philippinarum]|uniref:uncharacterized protein LOC132721803 n=1 Tax=Ruditapes philippinarum TaxID=129788 RepID=UPI00295B9430|nr:uncharacterized protein LOC132721803 [Ruditapes philippinarum]